LDALTGENQINDQSEISVSDDEDYEGDLDDIDDHDDEESIDISS